MVADWDANSPTLHGNLECTLRTVRDQATSRHPLNVEDAKVWHTEIMKGLKAPELQYVGRFRGEKGLQDVQVKIGQHSGVQPSEVSSAIFQFAAHLQKALDRLDELIPTGSIPDANTLDAVLDVCGWVHAEWVRIHPFANGNGRIARLWANYVAMRYGLPPFVRLRPRPHGKAYASASNLAMKGNWKPTAKLFMDMLADFLDEAS